MATRQLESIEDTAGGSADGSGSNGKLNVTASTSNVQQHGMGYDALFSAARDNRYE